MTEADRDNGFVFDVPALYAFWTGKWVTKGHPTKDRALTHDDVFAHLEGA